MSKVLVWKCDHDGKLFEDVKKYKAHLQKLAAERRHNRKRIAFAASRAAFLCRMGQEVTSAESLVQFIKDNWEFFFLNGAYFNNWRPSDKAPKAHACHAIKVAVSWSNSVRNSHAAPMYGQYAGMTNWDGRNTTKDGLPLPNGYPGWHGRIDILVKVPPYKYRGKEYSGQGHGSDYFRSTVVNTGTGGFGGTTDAGIVTYSYDVSMFADDFPAWAHEEEKVRIWEILKS